MNTQKVIGTTSKKYNQPKSILDEDALDLAWNEAERKAVLDMTVDFEMVNPFDKTEKQVEFKNDRKKMPSDFWNHCYNPITGYLVSDSQDIESDKKKYYRN